MRLIRTTNVEIAMMVKFLDGTDSNKKEGKLRNVQGKTEMIK